MIKTEKLTKLFATEEVQTKALNEVTLQVEQGEFVAIMGPSGCGKSTLLNILGTLDSPTSGSYLFEGKQVDKMNENQLTALRKGQPLSPATVRWTATACSYCPCCSDGLQIASCRRTYGKSGLGERCGSNGTAERTERSGNYCYHRYPFPTGCYVRTSCHSIAGRTDCSRKHQPPA